MEEKDSMTSDTLKVYVNFSELSWISNVIQKVRYGNPQEGLSNTLDFVQWLECVVNKIDGQAWQCL